MARAHTRGDEGFTLVELLVVIVLLGVVGAVVLTGIVRSLGIAGDATDRVEALTSLQIAQERMSRTIRFADPLISATPTRLELEVIDDATSGRQVVYELAGDELTLTATPLSGGAATTSPLIGGLRQGASPVFTYFETAGVPWTSGDVSDIRQVRVTLLRPPADDAPAIPLTTSVYIRNTEVSE